MAKAARQLVPVSERALVQRINRALAKEHGKVGSPPFARVQLKKTKGARALFDLGEYYEVDVSRNFIREHHVDIEAAGRELKCLEPWEKLVEEAS
jgi:hypothetical protein